MKILKNTGLTITFTIIILIVLSTVGFYITKKPERKSINPEIYPAFRTIENHCLVYVKNDSVEPIEYENCKKLVNRLTSLNSDNTPSTEEWYDFIISLDFDLPTLYLDRTPTKEEYDYAMEEQDGLEKIQSEIIYKQYEKSFDDIEYLKNSN